MHFDDLTFEQQIHNSYSIEMILQRSLSMNYIHLLIEKLAIDSININQSIEMLHFFHQFDKNIYKSNPLQIKTRKTIVKKQTRENIQKN